MATLSRRSALMIAGGGTVALLAGGTFALQQGVLPRSDAPGAETFREPREVHSEHGVLRTTLDVSQRTLTLDGATVSMLTYNGSVPGDTWRVQPGDRIEVTLTNRLDAATNLHVHGLEASPQDNSDNPFITVNPNESFTYVFELPDDHPTGLFWYHPHLHGSVAQQVFGGLYGAIIIDDGAGPNVHRERLLIISDISHTGDGALRTEISPHESLVGRQGETVLVNGDLLPTLHALAGTRERWRVLNACVSRYLRFTVPRTHTHLLGVDGGHEPSPEQVSEVFLAPGNRADLTIDIMPGAEEVHTLEHQRSSTGGGHGRMSGMGGVSEAQPLALLHVTKPETDSRETNPTGPPAPLHVDRDLRNLSVVRERNLTFTMPMSGNPGGNQRGNMDRRGGGAMAHEMGFDGLSFDAERVDQHVTAGTVEAWRIHNPTMFDHPFHLHVWPMQVVEENGAPVTQVRWRDVVNVTPGESVRVLIDFSGHDGLTVYHCHILDHEDAGMMGVIEVAQAPSS